jgi:hypothetical protein
MRWGWLQWQGNTAHCQQNKQNSQHSTSKTTLPLHIAKEMRIVLYCIQQSEILNS